MSAVYTQSQRAERWDKWVVFAICSSAHVVMPTASGEVMWRGDKHG